MTALMVTGLVGNTNYIKYGVDVNDELLDALVTNAFDVMGVVSRVAAAHELSLTQLRMLAILRDHHPRMSELAEHLGLDRSSISGLVARAEMRGLVQRTADKADGRVSCLELTSAGRELARIGAMEIRAGVEPLSSRLVGRLPS